MLLKELAEIRTGLVLSRKKASLSSELRIPYPLLSLKDFADDIRPAQSMPEDFIAAETIKEIYLTQPGDVIVRLRKPVRALHIDPQHAGRIVPSLMAIIRIQDAPIDPRYLAYTINSPTAQMSLTKEIKGTRIATIRARSLEDLDIPLPPMAVQEKIVTLARLQKQEQHLLAKLIREKERLSQALLDRIIQQNKED